MEPGVIRPAAEADLPIVVTMGRHFFDEAGYGAEFEFVPADFEETARLLIDAGLLFVLDRDGEVLGMAGADVAKAYWNRAVGLGGEVFWYIMPGHRNGMGKQLLAAIEGAARRHGAVRFDAVAEFGKRSAELGRLYRRQGYVESEIRFRKVL